MSNVSELIKRLRDTARKGTSALDDLLNEAADMLEQMEKGEPVAWEISYTSAIGEEHKAVHRHNSIGDYRQIDPMAKVRPLFTHPPMRELRDAEISDIAGNYNTGRAQGDHDFARAILAAQQGTKA